MADRWETETGRFRRLAVRALAREIRLRSDDTALTDAQQRAIQRAEWRVVWLHVAERIAWILLATWLGLDPRDGG
jgi:hypothetical protein